MFESAVSLMAGLVEGGGGSHRIPPGVRKTGTEPQSLRYRRWQLMDGKVENTKDEYANMRQNFGRICLRCERAMDTT